MDVDLIVPSSCFQSALCWPNFFQMHSPNFHTIVGNKLQAPWQEIYQFLIDQASDSHTLESPIRRHHIIKGARFTLRYELFSRSGLGFDDICDLGNRSPFFVRTEGFGHVLARLSWGGAGRSGSEGWKPRFHATYCSISPRRRTSGFVIVTVNAGMLQWQSGKWERKMLGCDVLWRG